MQSKSKATKRQAKEREQRWHKKLAKQRQKSKGTAHGPRPTRNQHEVAKRLLAGEVAMVGGTGWSFVEPFQAFLGEVGFFELLRVDGEKFLRQMAEISLLILTDQVKVLLGLSGMNCIGTTLFRDLALLKLIGYTSAQLHLYGLRSLIENTLFRELKQGWFISRFPKKTADAARGHVFLTLTIFNLTNAYRTEAGQALARRGIRRQRRQWQDAHYVLVFAGESYAIFDIEAIFILLGRPPEICWRVNPADIYRKDAADGLRQPA